MTKPQMHCANPDCVDDSCHGECLTSTEPATIPETTIPETNSSGRPQKIEELHWNSWAHYERS